MLLLSGGPMETLQAACENIIKKHPRQALAHHALGLIHAWSGRFEIAATHLGESLRPPFSASSFLHLAHVLRHGLLDELSARVVIEKGIAFNLNDPDLQALQHGPSTSETPETADDWFTLLELAKGHRIEGRYTQAAHTLLKGLLHSPLNPGFLEELGVCKQAAGMHTESAGLFRALTRVAPENAESWCRLGTALLACGDPEAAAVALKRAIQIRPQWHLPFRHLAMAQLQSSEHDDAVRSLNHCTRLAPEDAVSLSQHLFSLNYVSPHLQAGLPCLYALLQNQFSAVVCRPPLPSELPKRLKIAYVSPDFSNHPVAYFVEPLLEYRDKESFELFAYCSSPKVDSTTIRLKSYCDHWRDAWALTDASLVSRIQEDGIHILVDLSGHTPGNRLKVFASRPAPLQVTMIGCMQTTGLPSMDLRITDRFLNPTAPPEYHSESPLLMDSGAVVFRPPDEAPEVTGLPCLTGTPFTFASLNDPAKVTEETLALWAKILHETPGSELLLVRRPGCKLKKALQNLGISADRIKERGYGPLHAYLAMHSEVDLALDPFPYNGLTVTLMACWMGVPTIALTGLQPPARTAANVLSRMGLQEFVCETAPSYIDTAVRMFSNRKHLATVRKTLRDRTRASWCNGRLYTQEFEKKIKAHLQDLIVRQKQHPDPVKPSLHQTISSCSQSAGTTN